MSHVIFVESKKDKKHLDNKFVSDEIKSDYVICDKKRKDIGKMLTSNHFDKKLVNIVGFVIDRFVESNVKNKARNR